MESFHSKSEALAYVEFGIERGQYQDCGRLTVIDSVHVLHGRKHHPFCKAHSLGRNDSYQAVATTYCPNGCHFLIGKVQFQIEQKALDRKKWWVAKGRAVVKPVKTVITEPFVWFQKLPTIVQSLLIILLIISLFPQFKQTIVEILKALKG